jgi:spermidine/putrescine transport system ATP-binding protein
MSDVPAISLRDVFKRFGATTALERCSLEVASGEFVSLLGPSGCGKTTLLRIVGGFLEPDEGEVSVQGKPMDGLPPNKRPVNTVFQSYALFPHKSVFGNVAFPLEVAGVGKAERAERVRELLALVRLPEFEHRGVSELSGGQAQRVALARALVGRPEVLLLDEPLAALDLKLRKAMQLELRRIHDRLGTTFVYVTHDQEEALTMSDRIVLMNDGAIVQQGTPRTIYDHPSDAFASDFLGEANLLEGSLTTLAADHAVVAIGDLTVETPALAAPASPGDRVMLSLRPERIAIDDGAARNQVGGSVQRLVFLGHTVRVLVEIEGGVLLAVQVPRRAGDRLAEGQPVRVGWERDDGVLLPVADPAAA